MASIKIIQNQDGTIAFLPPGPNPKKNQPAGVNENDTVTWNNQTERPLVVVAIGGKKAFVTDVFQPDMPSSPDFIVQKNLARKNSTLKYSVFCVDPAVPQYTIEVIPAPESTGG